MAIGQNGAVLRQLRTLFDIGTIGELTDGQLLERYANRDGRAAEAAFAALVERHGPMVLRTCRAIVHDPHEAEDAFQATFLVLVRRAGSLRVRDSLGPWLHQVALRTASCARAAAARRRKHERRAAERPATRRAGEESAGGGDLEPVLHEELGRLPERYRTAVVVCDLEGRTHEQAARHLGWPIGTVKSRLMRGRERLRNRLTRRGLTPSAGLLVAALSARPASAGLPTALADSTVRAAARFAPGQAAAEVVSAAVATLMEGGMRTMMFARLKMAATIAVAAGLIAAGARVVAKQEADARGQATSAGGEAGRRTVPERRKPDELVEPPDFLMVEARDALPGRPISGVRLVRPDGTISLGFYGDVYVAGLALEEVKEKVVVHLRKFLTDDQLGLVVRGADGKPRAIPPAETDRVSVTVDSCNSKLYYVQGGVARPGRFPLTGRVTVLDAIQAAGGLVSTSPKPAIRLVRVSSGGAGRYHLPVDYDAIVRADHATMNYLLMPGDRVIISPHPEAGEPAPVPPGHRVGDQVDTPSELARRLANVERKLDQLIKALEDSKRGEGR